MFIISDVIKGGWAKGDGLAKGAPFVTQSLGKFNINMHAFKRILNLIMQQVTGMKGLSN